MPVGIEVVNPSSRLMLTTLRANPVVRQKSTPLAEANDANAAIMRKVVLTYTNASSTSNPIPFIQGNLTFMLLTGSKTGSTWTWIFLVSVSIGTPVTCYVFDEPPNTYGNNGIEIYADAPGTPLLFGMHSSLKPLRVAAVTATAGALTAGRTYAGALGRFSGFRQWEAGAKNPDGDADIDWYALITYANTMTISGHNYSYSTQRMDPPTANADGTDAPDYLLEAVWPIGTSILADVTGY